MRRKSLWKNDVAFAIRMVVRTTWVRVTVNSRFCLQFFDNIIVINMDFFLRLQDIFEYFYQVVDLLSLSFYQLSCRCMELKYVTTACCFITPSNFVRHLRGIGILLLLLSLANRKKCFCLFLFFCLKYVNHFVFIYSRKVCCHRACV